MNRPDSRHRVRRPSPAARRFGLLLVGILLAGAAAGCSATPVKGEYAAQALQAQVLAVTESAAAANDPINTLALLDDLVAKLNGAVLDGEITVQRHEKILAAITALRAELRTEITAKLQAAGTATAAAAPAPADVAAPADQTDAAVPAAVLPAPFIARTAPVAPPLVRARPVAQPPVVQAPAVQPPAVQPPAAPAPVAPAPAPSPTHSSHGNGNGNGNGWGNGNDSGGGWG